ncbi:phosphomannomutase [Qingshengfaniella alkalisoli]|uniref:Phosphomannomutase n=1 Tax=Qingshengfaniella alkalisoli TaxID=2599296 RepID=A0A5B8I8S0_9RHOB|nr:phosphomannomutase [Qingshengfaniella alkalisoli]QDY70179.1 phosphomannomutase [Qingshengfaniella alkalisoli]
MTELTCFKSYDIRGRVGDDLTANIAFGVGRAFAAVIGTGLTVVGRDARTSSAELQAAVIEGLRAGGSDVIDIGLCGTEEVYFATDHFEAVGGLMITGSHNPIDDNGIKMVRQGARPISRASGLQDIHDMVARGALPVAAKRGDVQRETPRDAYVQRVLSFADLGALKPLKIAVNSGNGAAGPTFDAIARKLKDRGVPLTFERLHHEPDGSFPNGIPNPLLPENRPVTGDAVVATGADVGIAWDGDFDRCFLFDETGAFVDGEYIVGLLAAAFLTKEDKARIVHDPRVQWNTQAIVQAGGGEAVVSRTGHALIKEKMREVDAIYGGEMSAHHYFRDFMYCDSGMVPWLLMVERMSISGKPLSEIVADMRKSFPSSGEMNFRLDDPVAAVARVESQFVPDALDVDRLDGLSCAFADWRFNLRQSNTEPVIRLNVETRGDRDLLAEKVDELSTLLTQTG